MKRNKILSLFLSMALLSGSFGFCPVYAEEDDHEPLQEETEEEIIEEELEDIFEEEDQETPQEETYEEIWDAIEEDDTVSETEDISEEEPEDTVQDDEGDPEEFGEEEPEELTGIEKFVTRLYQIVLLRDPDEGGFQYWTNGLTDGSVTGASAVKGFFLSAEMTNRALSNEDFVKALYAAVFGREADAGGLKNWTDRLNVCMSRAYVVNGFLNSQEFGNLCTSYGVTKGTVGSTGLYRDKNYNVTAFVSRMYTIVLSRAADVSGVENWCKKILSKNNTGADLIYGFFFSPEFLKKKLSNENFIKTAYRAMFDREGDTNGINNWVAKLNKKYSRKEVLAGFIASKEFTVLCGKFGIKRGSLLVGWINWEGKRCYVKSNGKRAAKEVLTISGKQYGFNDEGYYIGAKTAKYLTVYKKGIKLFNEVTNDSMTKVQKLRACFEILRTYKETNPWIPHDNSYGWVERYATHCFDNRWGNCMCFAACFGIMAQIAGYDNVYCCNSRTHGWVEIDNLVYDPERSIYLPGNFFGRPINSGGGALPDYATLISRAAPSNEYYKL